LIYEIRTYTLNVSSVPEVEKRFAEAYEARKKYSELLGFFHTEIGELNQVIHIWPYESLEAREKIRAEAAKDANWPPKIQEFITAQTSEILVPFPFVTPLEPGNHGPFYELRYYNYRPGNLPALMKSWEAALPERTKRSPVALAGSVEFGEPNRFIHIWPYKSLNDRMDTRTQAVKDGIWPPPGGGHDRYFMQRNKIMLPSSFSPLQ
jgi:hypothetical protein